MFVWNRRLPWLLAPLLASQVGCVGYIAVQGVHQLKLLAGREPIDELLAAGDLDPTVRQKLELIVDLQRFAEASLGMKPAGTYTTANLGFTEPIYNVSACEPLAFHAHTWWFPVVGKVPYKGFFREKDALRQRDALLDDGLDVVMREVGAYSTLGFFNDPVLPGMLDYSELGLVDLIFHELAHGVLYFPGKVEFNESFASFVGKWGSFDYLDARAGAGLPPREEAERRYDDQRRHQAFMVDLYARLDAVYTGAGSDEDKRGAKASILAEAQEAYWSVPFESHAYQGRQLGEINNADLMSFQRYHSGEEGFHDLFTALGGEWPKFFQVVSDLDDAEDPFQAVVDAASKARNPPPSP